MVGLELSADVAFDGSLIESKEGVLEGDMNRSFKGLSFLVGRVGFAESEKSGGDSIAEVAEVFLVSAIDIAVVRVFEG